MNLKRRLQIDYYVGGLLHFALKPLVVILGVVLRRDHRLEKCSTVTILKLLGGGSLVIAYPSLLALKRSGRVKKLQLVATRNVKPFGEALGVFDEIIVIRDEGFWTLLLDSVRAIFRLFHCEAIVDLEVHSRLTTVFCLLTCARNRIGFYTANSFWRQRISTHLLFMNQSTGVFWFYDQIANLFGAEAISFREASRTFIDQLAARSALPPPADGPRIGVAASCSDLGRERLLRTEEWVAILKNKVSKMKGKPTIHLLGGPSDRAYLAALAAAIEKGVPGIAVQNRAGEMSLTESIAFMRSLEELIAIDSALLHYARLMGVKTTSYWGPTDPGTRLRPTDLAMDVVHYQHIPCSPCVHIAAVAPCKGNNVCMRFAANPKAAENPNPTWLA